MEERNGCEKLDEVMLPGFRFHPTDEELVGFYLKRKIQQRPLAIELIKQLDIYKFDPWDLPSKTQNSSLFIYINKIYCYTLPSVSFMFRRLFGLIYFNLSTNVNHL
jgi:hypothetical protein